MTDFTPGPWKVVGTHQNRILARFDGPNGNEHHTEIATVTTGQMSSSYSAEMGDANARLIAAAPELYEALAIAERALNQAWRTVDAICGANHGEPLPIDSLPKDRQEMVYELASTLSHEGERVAAALRMARGEP